MQIILATITMHSHENIHNNSTFTLVQKMLKIYFNNESITVSKT